MGRLRDAAKDSFDISKKRVPAPDWLPRTGLIVFAIALSIIGLSALWGSGTDTALTPITTLPPKVIIPGTTTTTNPNSPVPTTPSAGGGDGTTTTTQSNGEPTVTLADGNGGTIQVPSSAYQQALAVARATFGSGVLIETRAAYNGTETIVFTVVWDPDGGGPQPRELLDVTVTKTDGGWQAV